MALSSPHLALEALGQGPGPCSFSSSMGDIWQLDSTLLLVTELWGNQSVGSGLMRWAAQTEFPKPCLAIREGG